MGDGCRIRREEFGLATRKGDIVLFRQGAALQEFPLNPNAKDASPHKIVAQADGSVLASFEDGLVGFRGR